MSNHIYNCGIVSEHYHVVRVNWNDVKLMRSWPHPTIQAAADSHYYNQKDGEYEPLKETHYVECNGGSDCPTDWQELKSRYPGLNIER